MNTRQLHMIMRAVLFMLVTAGTTLHAQTDSTGAAAPYPGFDIAPKVTIQVPPVYPPQALKDGIVGTVYLETKIDALGTVSAVKVTKSDADVLNDAAMEAVRKWRFTPAKKDGKDIACTVTIPFKFQLSKDGTK